MENNRLPIFSVTLTASILFGLLNLLAFYLSLPKYNSEIWKLEWPNDEIYKIEFSRLAEDGKSVSRYEINSNGKDLKLIEEKSAFDENQISATPNTLTKKENVFIGEGKSPDNRQKIEIQSFSLYKKITLNEKPIMRAVFLPFVGEYWVQEIKWLPDNRHLVISTGLEIGIYDTQTNEFARLVSNSELENL
jgi:hypothetical protein